MSKTKELEINLQPLTCKVSDGLYKKYLEKKYGVKVCTGKLADQDIEDLLENLELLKYLSTHKDCGCDREKLIENLK